MMDCETVRPLLDEFAQGELASPSREMVEEHLRACSSCQGELSAFRRTVRFLAEFGEVDAPMDFVQQVRERIEARQRRPILGRLLPQRTLARALAGVSCLILAGFGIWVAYRQLSPPGQIERYRVGEDSKPKKIARLRTMDDEFVKKTTDEWRRWDTKSGKELDVLEKGRSLENTLSFQDGDYLSSQDAARRAGGTAAGLGVLDQEADASVAAKPSRTMLAWGLKRGSSVEGELPLAKGGLETEAPGVTASTEEGTIHVDARPAPPSLKGPFESEALWFDDARQGIERAHEEGGEVRGFVAAPGTPPTGASGREKKDHTLEKRLEEAVEEERKEPESPRDASGSQQGGDAYQINGDSIESRVRENAPEREFAFTDMSSAGTSAGGRIEKQGARDAHGRFAPDEPGYEFGNGIAGREKAATILGQEQLPAMDFAIQEDFFSGTGNLMGGYYTLTRTPPELVLYVKDRQEALAEIKESVTQFGGAIGPVTEQKAKYGQAYDAQEGELIMVRLKAGTYKAFQEKLLATSRSPEAARRARGKPQVSAGKKEQLGKEEGITLLIRLVEIGRQGQPQQIPAQRAPAEP